MILLLALRHYGEDEVSQYECPTVPDRGVLNTFKLLTRMCMWDGNEEMVQEDRKVASRLVEIF